MPLTHRALCVSVCAHRLVARLCCRVAWPQPPVKVGWKTKMMRAVFGKLRKKAARKVTERDVAARLEREEAVRLIKRRIEEVDLKTFWLNVRPRQLHPRIGLSLALARMDRAREGRCAWASCERGASRRTTAELRL